MNLNVYGLPEKKFIHQVVKSDGNKLNDNIVYGANERTWHLFLECDLYMYERLCSQGRP